MADHYFGGAHDMKGFWRQRDLIRLKEVKKAAAERWVSAVNADGKFGAWAFDMVEHPTKVPTLLNRMLAREI